MQRDPARLGPGRAKIEVVGRRLRRAAPKVPVEPFGNRLCGQLAFPGTRIVVGDHLEDLADLSLADQLAANAVGKHRPLLASRLKDPLVFAGGLDHPPALADGEGQRFFGIDVFAGLAGVNRDQRPPMIGRGGGDGVDVAAFQQFAVVLVSGDLQPRGQGFSPADVGVGHGHGPDLLRAGGRQEDTAPLAADADPGDPDAVVRPSGQQAGGDQVRHGDAGRREGRTVAEPAAPRDAKGKAHGLAPGESIIGTIISQGGWKINARLPSGEGYTRWTAAPIGVILIFAWQMGRGAGCRPAFFGADWQSAPRLEGSFRGLKKGLDLGR